MSPTTARTLVASLMVAVGAVLYFGMFSMLDRLTPLSREQCCQVSSLVAWVLVQISWYGVWSRQLTWDRYRYAFLMVTIAAVPIASYIIYSFWGVPAELRLALANIVLLLGLVPTIRVYLETEAERKSYPRVICPKCRYNLAGLTTARCPECGTEYTLDAV